MTLHNGLTQAVGKHWNLDNQSPEDIDLVVNDLTAAVVEWLRTNEALVAISRGMLIQEGLIYLNVSKSLSSLAQDK